MSAQRPAPGSDERPAPGTIGTGVTPEGLSPGRADKFTERARHALQRARDAAQQLDYAAIGTEHLLLGLLDEDDAVAAQALAALGVDRDSVRAMVLNVIGPGQQPGAAEIGLTPRAKRALELAVAEAKGLKHRHIGTEYLLLGLLREADGLAAVILAHHGLTLARARAQVLETLAAARPGRPAPKTNVVMCRVDDRTLESLDLLIEAGLRTTRSDAAAWLIEVGIAAQSELFSTVAATAAEIRRLRAVAQTLVQHAAPDALAAPGEDASETGDDRPAY